MRSGGGHTVAADLVYLYAATQQWFFAERRYKAFDSEPVRLNHADLFLDRTGTGKRPSQQKADLVSAVLENRGGGSHAYHAPGVSDDDSNGGAEHWNGEEGTDFRRTTARAEKLQQPPAPPRLQPPIAQGVRKRYSQQYIWGQLNGWFKQTVYDPAATLSAERRGTLSLPDVESAYSGSAARYDMRVSPPRFHRLLQWQLQQELTLVGTQIGF